MYSLGFRRMVVGVAVAGMFAGWLCTVYTVQAAARPYLGVRLEAPAPEGEPGLILGHVNPGGPADKAGLKKGDRIIMAGGKTMQTYEDLGSVLASHKPGDDLDLKVLRDGKEETAVVKLGEAPATAVVTDRPPAGAFLGVLSEKLTADHRAQLGVKTESGVVVTNVLPGSPAAAAGLQPGDVITHVAATAVSTPDQLRDAITKTGAGTDVHLKVARAAQDIDIKARLQRVPAELDLSQMLRQFGSGEGQLMGPGLLQSLEKLPGLEKRVQELEKRVHELEQKLPK